ncbi:MAG: T9SS type A sorting domain-containing protein [Saprospiraceae bacterium]|nr:T9SS type A sorting domain-containing protein [Saprospiraceae bacterium]
MKYRLLFTLCVYACVAHAQNWLPLTPADQYSFRQSDSLLISNIIQADSQQILPSGDLLLFLNKVVMNCDTCALQPGKLANQGQFLQKTATRKQDNSWIFSGKTTFVLFPLAQPGDTWIFDTLQNVSATVQGIFPFDVFGEQDSIKTIQLSDGRQIILSKNHGLLRFPDGNEGAAYLLTGIPTRNLGENLPDWKALYDFNSGDILEYESNISWEPGTASNRNTVVKRRIIQRSTDADTLVYTVETFVRHVLQWSGPPLPSYSHSIGQWRIHPGLAEPWTVGYPGQFFQVPDVPNGAQGSQVRWLTDTLYGLSHTLGILSTPFQWGGCALYAAPDGGQEQVLACDPCGSVFYRQHAVGLGLVRHAISCFEVWDYGELRAWVKNGDTTGIITPDSFFLVSVKNEPLVLPVVVMPNPSADSWRLFFPEPLLETLQFSLIDTNGKLLASDVMRTGQSEYRLSGENLPAGVYLLQIRSKKGTKTLRLMRQ